MREHNLAPRLSSHLVSGGSVRRCVSLVLVAAWAMALVAPAAQADECDALLRYGIRDEYDTLSVRQHSRQVRDFVHRSEATTWEELVQEGSSLGISIEGIGGLSFGGHDARRSFSEWKFSYLAMTDEELQQYDSYSVRARTVSREFRLHRSDAA